MGAPTSAFIFRGFYTHYNEEVTPTKGNIMRNLLNLDNTPVSGKTVALNVAKQTGKSLAWTALAYVGFYFVIGVIGGLKGYTEEKNRSKDD